MSHRYLITGGAGFIGSHLAEALIARGDTVYILDDESTGTRENLRPILNHPQLKFTCGTIMDHATLSRLVGTAHYVIHLAAAVGVKYILDHPLDSIRTNVVGTEQVLRCCAEFEKPLLLASTSEVYGLQTKAPLREDDFCVLGATSVSRWSYACSKALDEFMSLAYHNQGKFPVTIVRLFNTVGPRQSPAYGMVIPRFVDQALADQPMTVFGDGSQSRTFTHVGDVIHALTKLIDKTDAAGQVYNIGGVEEVSMLDLAHRIKAMTNSGSSISLIPYDKVYNRNFQDMPRRVPDITKLKTTIGYAPTRTLDEILKDCIADRRGRQAMA